MKATHTPMDPSSTSRLSRAPGWTQHRWHSGKSRCSGKQCDDKMKWHRTSGTLKCRCFDGTHDNQAGLAFKRHERSNFPVLSCVCVHTCMRVISCWIISQHYSTDASWYHVQLESVYFLCQWGALTGSEASPFCFFFFFFFFFFFLQACHGWLGCPCRAGGGGHVQ